MVLQLIMLQFSIVVIARVLLEKHVLLVLVIVGVVGAPLPLTVVMATAIAEKHAVHAQAIAGCVAENQKYIVVMALAM